MPMGDIQVLKGEKKNTELMKGYKNKKSLWED
jgi:hypothetical protein